jgi:hypothetical protein
MKTSFIIILLFVTFPILAQPANPSGDPDVPIAGIEILIGLGGALGIRKLIIAKRSKSSEK